MTKTLCLKKAFQSHPGDLKEFLLKALPSFTAKNLLISTSKQTPLQFFPLFVFLFITTLLSLLILSFPDLLGPKNDTHK
jgi:hypothetical protein